MPFIRQDYSPHYATWQWGPHGKAYPFDPTDPASEEEARFRAEQQMRAIASRSKAGLQPAAIRASEGGYPRRGSTRTFNPRTYRSPPYSGYYPTRRGMYVYRGY